MQGFLHFIWNAFLFVIMLGGFGALGYSLWKFFGPDSKVTPEAQELIDQRSQLARECNMLQSEINAIMRENI